MSHPYSLHVEAKLTLWWAHETGDSAVVHAMSWASECFNLLDDLSY